MYIAGIEIDPARLIKRDELIDFLKKEGANDNALSEIKEKYTQDFGNELMWRYPYSDGYNMAMMIVVVREGFLTLPYNVVDAQVYEKYEVEQAGLLNAEGLQYFIDDYDTISKDLLKAMRDMFNVLSPKTSA